MMEIVTPLDLSNVYRRYYGYFSDCTFTIAYYCFANNKGLYKPYIYFPVTRNPITPNNDEEGFTTLDDCIKWLMDYSINEPICFTDIIE